MPKVKGGKVGPRTPKPGKGCSSMWGSEPITQRIRALPRAEHTLQENEPNMSAEVLSETTQSASHLWETRCVKYLHYPQWRDMGLSVN